jgi:hypothetical protein
VTETQGPEDLVSDYQTKNKFFTGLTRNEEFGKLSPSITNLGHQTLQEAA